MARPLRVEMAGGWYHATAGMGVMRFERWVKEGGEMANLVEKAKVDLLFVGM